LSLVSLGTETQSPQRARVPARHKLTLATVLAVDGIAELDEVGVATDSLREGPLEAVWVCGAFGAAGAGIAVGRAVVGDGCGGKIVPPLARGALGEEGVRVREEGRVGKRFLGGVSLGRIQGLS
jgi:hypothetical protein